MPDYQLLVFDWDGTLVDSIGRIVEAAMVASTTLWRKRSKRAVCSAARPTSGLGRALRPPLASPSPAICSVMPGLVTPRRSICTPWPSR